MSMSSDLSPGGDDTGDLMEDLQSFSEEASDDEWEEVQGTLY
jgi:hypothetical protein